MSKFIKLNSRKYPGYECIVDDEDYKSLVQYKWHPKVDLKHNTIYARRTQNKQTIPIHRYIIMMHGHCISNKLIDHKDRNGLNNQKENLRICSISDNQHNSIKSKRGKISKYKCVGFNKKLQKYNAYITYYSKQIHLGYFDLEIDAALAYNKKATELFREYACLNIIEQS